MAGTYNQEFYSLHKRQVTLHAVVAVGAAGAVTLQKWTPTAQAVAGAYSAASTAAANSFSPAGTQGITSVTKEATAGQWTFVLQDGFQRLLGATFTPVVATTGISTAAAMGVVKPSGVNGLTTGNTFTVQFADFAGAAVNPASGEVMLLTFELDQSPTI